MKRKLVMAVLIIVCLILQQSVFEFLSIGSITPNLLIILICTFGLIRGRRTGMFTGLVCGLLLDIVQGSYLGLHGLIYMYVGYCCGFCYRIFYDDDIKTALILTGIADIVYNLFLYLTQFLLRGRTDILFYLRRIIIPEVLYTLIITLVLYRFCYWINKKLEQTEQRSINNFV